MTSEPDPPVAVLLPGTASTGGFVQRAFGPALRAAGYALVTADPPRGPDLIARWWRQLDAAVRRHRPVLVGGVSLGAHLAAGWLAGARAGNTARAGNKDAGADPGAGIRGLLVALPGWLGRPGPGTPAVRAALASAERIAATGLADTLAAATGSTPGWLGVELTRAWSAYRPAELVATLRAAAASTGPTPAQLAAIDVPAGVVAFADDAVHPTATARRWAELLPRGRYLELPAGTLATDPAALGVGVVTAWRAACGHQGAVSSDGGCC